MAIPLAIGFSQRQLNAIMEYTPGFNLPYLWCNLRTDNLPKLLVGILLGLLSSVEDCLNGCSSLGLSYHIGGCILGAFLVWTGSSFIAGIIEDRFSWDEDGLKKSVIMIVSNIIFITLVIVLIILTVSQIKGEPVAFRYYINNFVATVIVTTIINLIYIARSIFNFWKHTKYENEVLKQENLRSQLETLKNQVNPHFLFNSLNTLISIIDDDPEIAKNYTQKLSQVYRYILQAKEKDIVTLNEELEFTIAYDYLLKIRYGNNLHFITEVDKKHLELGLPTLVLQMLVENAIKHNIISESKPLEVKIWVDEAENLVVSNNYQPKKVNVESDKVGLKNIAQRYKILIDKDIEIVQNEKQFIVKLPLIAAH